VIRKDLLVIYNTFGGSNDDSQYSEGLNSIFWHINENNLHNNVRVVVSSVLNQDDCIDKLKQKFGSKLKFIRYDYRWPVQVSFNKSVLVAEKDFNEVYEGYFYISAGITLPKVKDLFIRIIEKNNSGEFGLIQLLVDKDSGFGMLRERFREWVDKKTQDDFLITVGDYCNFHLGIFNRRMKEFYGVPLLDVYGICGMESGLTYTSYALRLKNIIISNSMCNHNPLSDRNLPQGFFDEKKTRPIPCGLNWGRTNDIFLNDLEGIEAGLGNYPGPYWGLPEVVLQHKKEKFDENYLSIDERLRYSIKRCYFTNKNELDYDNIEYTIE
jgi:hypothetical protein